MRTQNGIKRTIMNSKSKYSPVEKSSIQIRSKKPKIKKPSEQESVFSDSDILSSLPDNVLCHIISFLDTKSAIRTCMISKRFELLWTQLQNLHITSSDSDSRWYRPNFESKILTLLQRRDHQINLSSFRLSLYHHRPTEEFVKLCVDYAALHNVQRFRMRAYFRDTVLVPGSLVNSSSLTSLRLSNAVAGGLQFPMKVNMVNLKELHLKKFELFCESYDGALFRGCPSLESLVLDKCWAKSDDKLKVLEVDCATLRKLEIKHWRSHWTRFHEFTIEINAPKLVSFKLQGLIVRVVCKEILSCLDSVYFYLGYPTACAMSIINERKKRTLESILSMLGWSCKAKFMSLSWQAFEVLCGDPDLQLHSPITFPNLTSIRFMDEWTFTETRIPVQTVREAFDEAHGTFCFNDPWLRSFGLPGNVFQYFLENSPSLEEFYLQKENTRSSIYHR